MDNKIKAIIIDDEYPARLMIKSLAANHADVIEIIAETKNAADAIKLINGLNPDLLFLDINLPGISGFDLLSTIAYQPYIIFTTAYEEFALKAFEANSIDYLLKPIEEDRFARSIQKLQQFIKPENPPVALQVKILTSALQQTKKPSAIPIRIGDKIILIRFEDIVYLEARDKYVYLITAQNKQYLSDTRLTVFEDILPGNFIRVQKSFIINKDFIVEIHKYFGNRLIISMNDKNNTKITSGITYIHKIRASLGI